MCVLSIVNITLSKTVILSVVLFGCYIVDEFEGWDCLKIVYFGDI